MARNNSNNNGCGCLILIVLAIAFVVNKCDESKSNSNTDSNTTTSTAYKKPSNAGSDLYQFGEKLEDELSEEDQKYLNNSLSTGTAPYTEYYGKNYKCPYDQCSGIKVTAPQESDIVVIIKTNNSSGKVISHGFIKAGGTCFFPIPDGTYQTFFYYGKGWNPNKEMPGGIRGGFVEDEIFSKDSPQAIYSAELTYVLQLQRNGNFHTKGSNKNEVF